MTLVRNWRDMPSHLPRDVESGEVPHRDRWPNTQNSFKRRDIQIERQDTCVDNSQGFPWTTESVHPAAHGLRRSSDSSSAKQIPNAHWRDRRDEVGYELSSDAPVWRVYVEEASEYDATMIEGLNGSLDVLLIFAGLFSAVVTAFVMDSVRMLQPDLFNQSVDLLTDISVILRAQAAGVPLDSVQALPQGTFQVSSRAIRVNCLWFTSLGLSLAVSVLVMLAKQWLHHYRAGMSSAAHIQTALRQSRFDALRRWNVPMIIALLPTVLHASLGIFFIGLVDYLSENSTVVAVIPAIIFSLTGMLYLATTFLPFFQSACPFKTPLSMLVASTLADLMMVWDGWRQNPRPSSTTLDSSAADIRAVEWLIENSTKPHVIDEGLRALAGLAHDGAEIPMNRTLALVSAVRERIISCFRRTGPMSHEVILAPEMSKHAAAFTRSWIALIRHARIPPQLRSIDYIEVITMLDVLGKDDDPDVAAAGLAAGALTAHLFPIYIRRLPPRLVDIGALLSRSVRGTSLPPLTYLMLVDVLGECAPALEGDDLLSVAMATLPVLLELLPMAQSSPPDQLYCSLGVTLPVLALGYKYEHINRMRAEKMRRDHVDEFIIASLSPVVRRPSDFAIEQADLMELAALELLRSFFSYYLSSSERRLFILSAGTLPAFIAALEYCPSERMQSETLSAISLVPATYLPAHTAGVVFRILRSSTSEEVLLRAALTIAALAEDKSHIAGIIAADGIDLLIQHLSSSNREISRTSSYALCSFFHSIVTLDDTDNIVTSHHTRLFESLSQYFITDSSNWHDIRRWIQCLASFPTCCRREERWRDIVDACRHASTKLDRSQLKVYEKQDRDQAMSSLIELG